MNVGMQIGYLCLENENAKYYASSPPFRLKKPLHTRLSLVKNPIALTSLNAKSSNLPKEPQ
jgi:hypothetical protein